MKANFIEFIIVLFEILIKDLEYTKKINKFILTQLINLMLVYKE
jgi:hypothetical protein